MKKSAAMLGVALFFSFAASVNAEVGPFEKLGAACGEDIEKFCSSVSLGQGRVLACLEENKDKISAECDEARAGAQKQFESNKSTAH